MKRKTKQHKTHKPDDMDRARKGVLPKPKAVIDTTPKIEPESLSSSKKRISFKEAHAHAAKSNMQKKEASTGGKDSFAKKARGGKDTPRTKEEITLTNIRNEAELKVALNTINTAAKKIEAAQKKKKYPTWGDTEEVSKKPSGMSSSKPKPKFSAKSPPERGWLITKKDAAPKGSALKKGRKARKTNARGSLSQKSSAGTGTYFEYLKKHPEIKNKGQVHTQAYSSSRGTTSIPITNTHSLSVTEAGPGYITKTFPLSDAQIRFSQLSYKRNPEEKRVFRSVDKRVAMNEYAKESKIPSNVRQNKNLSLQNSNNPLAE
ncbi:hypothetical protein NECID01_0563 [Nematocida sp. AWRm77]|nr:hypothetical protein NECID01_0563 [Nematocida sp. AWRm77]